MTSDGISTSDWHRLHELAVDVVNAESEADNETALEALRGYLRELRARYGEKPSILATEADYADGPEQSRDLLLRAYDLALTSGDGSNLKEISLSLADLHVTELHHLAEARRWLEAARQWIDPSNELDWDEYCSIERSIAEVSK